MLPPPIPAVADFIEQLPAAQQRLAEQLRQLIWETLPQVTESFKWKVPFYEGHGLLCYLSPQTDCLVLGFIQGASLTDPAGLLSAQDRQQVRHFRVMPDAPLPREDLRSFLIEAWLINEATQT
jgi:hypothetical protein